MKYFLYFLKGSYQGKRYGLDQKTIKIGRMPDNHIAFPGNDVSVSRYHAVLTCEKGMYFISDLASKNGTLLNGKRIPPKVKNHLKPMDTIQLGSNLITLMPINTQNNSENEQGFFDKIGKSISKGFKKFETIIMEDPFSDKKQPKPIQVKPKPVEQPMTVFKENKPIFVDQLSDVKLSLQDKLASGGMSVIYKAMFMDTKEIVAIKFPRPEVATDQRILNLFKEEIRMSLKFKHPNTIHTLMAINYNKLPTMVMEYFPSKPLSDYIPHLAFSQAKSILYQTINGLESIHAKHIIHNDIKPGNVIVNDSFHAKICDFGTAGDINQINKSRKDWEMIGTPLYMSPEQLTPGSLLNFTSDIYALGLVMYEVFTRQHPFRSGNMTEAEIKNKQLTVIPTNPCEVNLEISLSLGKLIMKAIHKEPRQRFQSIRELKKAYEDAF